MSKTDITLYLRINWRTVGSCLRRAHERIEPDVTDRVHDGLEEICVDELCKASHNSSIPILLRPSNLPTPRAASISS